MVKSFRLSMVNRYNSQKGVRYVNKRLLDLLRKARSLKKRSFFISPKYCCLCLRVHCLIDGILLFCVHTHLAFFFYIVAYCLCSRCRCTIHSVRLPHVSACPLLWATGGTEYFSFVSKRIVASCLSWRHRRVAPITFKANVYSRCLRVHF